MISERFRNALGAFSMVMIVGGLVFGLAIFVIAIAYNPSGQVIGAALAGAGKVIFGGVMGGGILRTLVSIDARLEQRT